MRCPSGCGSVVDLREHAGFRSDGVGLAQAVANANERAGNSPTIREGAVITPLLTREPLARVEIHY